MNTQQSLYESDYYGWLYDTANKLKLKKFDELDLENIVEEIEGLAKSDYRELVNRLIVLIAHLLKWQYQPILRSSGWRGTIREQRRKINLLLSDSPSLKYKLKEQTDFSKLYEESKTIFFDDTGIDVKILPESNPYSIEELLIPNYYPD